MSVKAAAPETCYMSAKGMMCPHNMWLWLCVQPMSGSAPKPGDIIFVYMQGKEREKWGGVCMRGRRHRGGAVGICSRDLKYRGRGKIRKK